MVQVLGLDLSDYGSLYLVLLIHVMDELLCLLFHVETVHALFMKTVGFLLLHVEHLVFEIVLHFLVFPELKHLTLFSLHFVPSCVIIDHFTPKLVLLFLHTHTHNLSY